MITTKHASKRAQQRGFTSTIIDLILENGEIINGKDGAHKITLSNKSAMNLVSSLRKTIQIIDKAKGGCLVIKDQNILTVYKVH